MNRKLEVLLKIVVKDAVEGNKEALKIVNEIKKMGRDLS